MLRIASLVWLCLCTAGCVGGQSGTESGGMSGVLPTFDTERAAGAGCGCALASQGVLVQATLTSSSACGVRARVEAVLGAADGADDGAIVPGTEIGGTPLSPCGEGLSLSAGQRVIMVHVPGDQAGSGCAELQACQAACPAPSGQGDEADEAELARALARYEACAAECGAQTREACAARADEARLHGQVLVAALGDELVLSEGETTLSLPRAQAPALLDPLRCGALLYPDAVTQGPGEGEPRTLASQRSELPEVSAATASNEDVDAMRPPGCRAPKKSP